MSYDRSGIAADCLTFVNYCTEEVKKYQEPAEKAWMLANSETLGAHATPSWLVELP
jgi:hypothetical protein